MSKIDDLIQELCPGGVKFYPLGDLVEENLGGGTPSRSQPNFWGGEIAWASVGDLTASELELRTARQSITQEGLQSSSTNLIPEGWVVAAVKIAPGEMRVVKSPVAINQDLRGLRLKSSLDPRFLVFYSKTLQVRSNGTIVKGITNDSLKRISVPLPPLLIQKEIVSILDKFTQLEAQLEAELEARKTQYEVTRDRLLDFSGDLSAHPMGEKIRELSPQGVAPLPLGAFGEFVRGSGLEKKDLLTEGLPAVHYGEVHTHYGFWTDRTKSFVLESKAKNMKKAQPGDVVVVTTSEDEQDVGKPLAWVGQTDLNVGGESYIFKSKLDPFFTAQLFLSQAFKRQSRKYLSGTKVKRISSSNLEKIVVCIPPLEIQRRIGETLKAMDALVNDISIGLPAEIEARRKQYEHYRNRLLTFKELDAA